MRHFLSPMTCDIVCRYSQTMTRQTVSHDGFIASNKQEMSSYIRHQIVSYHIAPGNLLKRDIFCRYSETMTHQGVTHDGYIASNKQESPSYIKHLIVSYHSGPAPRKHFETRHFLSLIKRDIFCRYSETMTHQYLYPEASNK